MRTLLHTILKLYLGGFLLLTSLFCLLAYIPYTYFFLIKEPPYGWLIGFAQYHSWFYWSATAAAAFAYWPYRKNRVVLAAWSVLVVTAILFSWDNFLVHISQATSAYLASLLAPAPLLLLAGMEMSTSVPQAEDSSLFSYLNAVIAILAIAILSAGGVWIKRYFETGSFAVSITLRNVEQATYILAAYLWLALLAVSLGNLLTLASRRIVSRAGAVRPLLLGIFVWTVLSTGAIRFLENMLTFRGWPTYLYGVILGASLTGWGFITLRPVFFAGHGDVRAAARKKALAGAIGGCFAVAMLLAPTAIGEHDWSGILQYSFTLLLWTVLILSVYALRPGIRTYSAAALCAVLVLGGSGYWALQASAFIWARQVGTTDGAIVRVTEDYAAQNVSFDLAYHWMSSRREAECGELCLTLRQYTNIPNPNIQAEIKLAGQLTPVQQQPPNIFIIVVDSLRRDYLGAYNSRVDFTPNLDAFARDSVVIPDAYSQYAGTSLSEPAIWAGALLLHTHDWRSFDQLNSLRKLLNFHSYRMIVSYDEVLRHILPPSSNLLLLDADKRWNRLEIGDTVRQLKTVLDHEIHDGRPIFFYSQPKNVHQFAVNDRPLRTTRNWTDRPNFNNRIAFEVHQVDESLGDLFQYLKSRGLYENSIIILTSDHGDATQQSGRLSHSTIIYPEVMQVPLIIHLPSDGHLPSNGPLPSNRTNKLTYDSNAVASLIDITPTLYYLLGHKPDSTNPLFGHPLLAGTLDELRSYPRRDLLLASDVRAAYGLLTDGGRFMYVTYDSPAQNFLFDLVRDPEATQNVLTDAKEKKYQQRIIEYLRIIADFYGYKPTGSLRQPGP